MNDLQEVKETNQDQMLSIIEKVALDPNADITKLEKMLDMQERIFNKNAEIAFNNAMARVQEQLPSVAKSKKGENSNYADLGSIIKACSPVWTKEGFSLTFGTDKSEIPDHIGITCTTSHSAGFSRFSRWDLPLDNVGAKGTPNKTRIQGSGSTVSYGRRYLTCMIFNIATFDDNDGAKQKTKELPKISVDQATVIEDLIKETGADKFKFLKFLKVESVESIPAQAYSHAVKSLEAKRK